MRILLTATSFRPAIGGLETVAEVLADAFIAAGHEVTVATRTASDAPETAAYRVLRRPSLNELVAASMAADVILQNHLSLRLGLPGLLLRRPTLIAHHMWTARRGRGALLGRIKHIVSRLAANVAVSEALAATLTTDAVVIPNPYDDEHFVARPDAIRDRDLVFLGRLIPEKGVDVLLDALDRLRNREPQPTATIVGNGPDEQRLRDRCATLGLGHQVRFAGALRGAALIAELNRHQVLVVPSVCEETFGVVVLEGLACGLVPVVSRSGGLPEAVGSCGAIVQKADPTALAAALTEILGDADAQARYRAGAAAHLARHARRTIAERYLERLAAIADTTRRC